VREAVQRGVLLDVGHGAGGFSFHTAEVMLDAGLTPTTISSDLHQLSAHGPMVDLLTCMNKILALGVPLEDVATAATSAPARVAGVSSRAGTLAVSAPADLAVVALEEGSFELYDVTLQRRTAERRLRSVLTIVGGRILPPVLPEPPVPWVHVPEAERAAYTSLRDDLMTHRGLDAGDVERFAVPDLLDWGGHA
jgi:dihydroorotase